VGISLALHLLQSQRVREDEESIARREKYKGKNGTKTPV
jgi:hypothetical protein